LELSVLIRTTDRLLSRGPENPRPDETDIVAIVTPRSVWYQEARNSLAASTTVAGIITALASPPDQHFDPSPVADRVAAAFRLDRAIARAVLSERLFFRCVQIRIWPRHGPILRTWHEPYRTCAQRDACDAIDEADWLDDLDDKGGEPA